LIFSGNGEKGVVLPLSDWGTEFADNLPEAILEAIRAARGDLAGTIEDEEYRKRLQEKFGNRWSVKALVKAKHTDKDGIPASVRDEETEVIEPPGPGSGGRRRRRKTIKVVRKRAVAEGNESGVLRETPVDVPKYRLDHASSFEQPWHLALWAPNDTEGPTVLLNVDSPILQEIVEHHQEQYPDVYAEEVAKVVRQVFGEVAACKIAHSQKLARKITAEELDRDYRSEQALTLALMGLMAEESVISQRLGRFGRKKTQSSVSVS